MTTWLKRITARMGLTLCLCCVLFTPAIAADNAPTTPATTATVVPDAIWAALFDESMALPERQAMLAKLEQAAGNADPHDLYMLGSLYHMGQHAHGSPAQADAEKASIYLANAAVRGNLLAMAKLAEVKLAAGQYREAMNWAQIYVHYAVTASQTDEIEENYGAELIKRISENVNRSAMDTIMKDVTNFLAVYDASIRAGMAGSAPHLSPKSSARHRYIDPTPGQPGPGAGVADFLVTFRADGTATHVQLIDAVPRTDVADALRAHASALTIPPADDADGTSLRYAWIPMVLGDGLYGVRNKH